MNKNNSCDITEVHRNNATENIMASVWPNFFLFFGADFFLYRQCILSLSPASTLPALLPLDVSLGKALPPHCPCECAEMRPVFRTTAVAYTEVTEEGMDRRKVQYKLEHLGHFH